MTSPIAYDRRSFKFHNRPFLILSGSVHYIRQHPSTWATIFASFAEAGLNTLETYVFWSAHDRHPDPPDFTGRNDVFGFIKAAGDAGLHVILRLGPYVCAEVSYGGFPFRLRDTPNVKFRTFNAAFMGEVEAWVRLIAGELHARGLLAPAGGPVMLVQLENEYAMVSESYADEGARYLQWCADLQRELGLGVPGIMCLGAAEGVVETINAFYGHELLPAHRARHDDQPALWTECWTGWYDTWGGAHHVRGAADLAYAVARFFAAGGAGVNYYMWAGGVNYGREGMYLQASSYDYDAPVDETGRMGGKARHLARLHAVLKRVEGRLLGTEAVVEGGVYRWGDVSFVCNDGEGEMAGVGLTGGRYGGVVKGRSVHIVEGGRCLFDTAAISAEDAAGRAMTRLGSATNGWEYFPEGVPTLSGDDARVRHETDAPKEQLSMTRDASDYGFYVTRVRGRGRRAVRFEAADVAYVFVDGGLAGGTAMPPWEDRWANKWNRYDAERGTAHEVVVALDGEHELCVMTAALGLVKGDWQMRRGVGMEAETKGLLSDVKGVERTCRWVCMGGLAGEAMLGSMPFGDVGDGATPGWFRCRVTVAVAEACFLDLGGVGKGLLWVNDVLLGRFWDVNGTRPMNGFLRDSPIRLERVGQPTQRFYHVPEWVIGVRRGDGFVMNVVLFVERGAPKAPLQIFQSC